MSSQTISALVAQYGVRKLAEMWSVKGSDGEPRVRFETAHLLLLGRPPRKWPDLYDTVYSRTTTITMALEVVYPA